MRKIACVCVLLGMVAPTVADLFTKVRIDDGLYGADGGGSGGEFKATVTQGWLYQGSQFTTFCVELNEYVNLGSEYYVELSTSAKGGGLGGGEGGVDELSFETAALYLHYLSLGDGYSNELANLYQLAIWAAEHEVKYVGGEVNQWVRWDGGDLLNDYENIPLMDVINLIADMGEPNSIGGVRVMRLWQNADGTGACQDMLTFVPVPQASLLGLFGITLVGGLRRRE